MIGNLPSLFMNKGRICQVFRNLISNAVRYVGQQKGEIKIDYQLNNKEHLFFVADNGPGIAPDYHEKIFQIFQTLDTKDEVETTGLGLSIAKKIIERENGKIWVESEPGKGAAFWFSLPVTEESEKTS